MSECYPTLAAGNLPSSKFRYIGLLVW